MMRPLPLWISLLIAPMNGMLLGWAFPGPSIWVFSLIVPLVLFWTLWGRRFWTSLLIGFVFAATFWLVLINWLTLYLGPIPWLALGILQAVFMAIAVAAMSFVINSSRSHLLAPVVIASIWSAKEILTSLWPYGGFSWAKIAQAQANSPFAHDVAWVGTSGLSFLLVLFSAIVFQLLRAQAVRWMWFLPLGLIVALTFAPAFAIEQAGSVDVMAVQGNSKAGLFDRHQPGEILNDHLSETLTHKQENVDVVVWPENASDIDPLSNDFAWQQITAVSAEMNAPIITGTITQDSAGRYFNSSVIVDARSGLIGQYDKVHPVPFAEYMPDRQFWRALQPDLVDLVQLDYTFGTRPSVVSINGVATGIQICFDVTDDVLSRILVNEGGQYIVLQTNNADFGTTVESVQQLAITKLRAIETGRSIVSVSTVGASVIYAPDGTVIDSIPAHVRGAMTAPVSLSNTITPAIYFGPTIDTLIVTVALSGLLLCAIRQRF